jgi:hypothetical protein
MRFSPHSTSIYLIITGLQGNEWETGPVWEEHESSLNLALTPHCPEGPEEDNETLESDYPVLIPSVASVAFCCSIIPVVAAALHSSSAS